MKSGYYRHPTVFKDQIVFVSEDDLWRVSASGGVAHRLTATNGMIRRPFFSPDGKHLAFSSFEEGALEVYVMPSSGGEVKRLTYIGGGCDVFGWASNSEVLFSSAARFAMRATELLKVDVGSGQVTALGLGPGTSITISASGAVAMERNSNRPDPAHWKRYRGGTAGQLWTAPSITGTFTRILTNVKGNFATPQWFKDRLYFLSDHEGWGNIFSCRIDGSDLQKHTEHKDFYARNLNTDGHTFVYHSGADIFVYDPADKRSRKVEIEYHSQKPQRQRRFVSPARTWENIDLSPKGDRVVFGSRGQVFAFENWQGPLFKSGTRESVRYRLARWIDGDRFALISDHQGHDQIEIYNYGEVNPSTVIEAHFGQILEIKVSPDAKYLAISNHRNELLLLNLETRKVETVTQNECDFLFGDFNWSPDSRWLAFSQNVDKYNKIIQIYGIEDRETRTVTRPGIRYASPAFDPAGEYLYFIGAEMLNPVYSDVMFDVFFPRTHLPCVLPLKRTTESPFIRHFTDDAKESKAEEKKDAVRVEIDFENIESRMLSFPVAEARYSKIIPAKGGKVYYMLHPVEGTLGHAHWSTEPEAKAKIKCFDFKLGKEEDFISGITEFDLSKDGQWQVVRVKTSVHVGKAGEKPKLDRRDKEFNSKSGWIDFKRVKLMVDPPKEWRQMYGEVWRLQRDYYWVESMSKINWQRVYDQYLPLIDRVSCRSEFSDLVWEMQGELGTSHAYEIGGDTKPFPNYPVGHLGADFKWNSSAYEVTKIYDGEISRADKRSPLLQPGLNCNPGDQVLAVDGQPLSAEFGMGQALLHKAGAEVELRLRAKNGEEKAVRIKTLVDDKPNRYRDWVETNRRYVHEKSNGKLGYVHIPDMGPEGYSEFFRNYLREFERDGLVIDARYNGGGNVSQLILDYLSRRRVGFDKSRWLGVEPYPNYSPSGALVALTNQYAGSDGDIFPHAFKLMKLGPLIGQRTWGGVIGIHPRNFLADGGITTQPEFSFWFVDVGWGVENYGTDPDIVIDIAPHEFLAGRDPQLDRGIAEALALLTKKPPLRPDWKSFPDLSH